MECEFPVDRIDLRDITAGTTLALSVRLRGYASPAWTLSLALRGPAPIDVAATADTNGGWFVGADAATTATWTAGKYWYAFRVTNGGSVFEVGAGEITVLPNLAAIEAAYDGSSANEIALAAIDAVLQSRATRDQEQYKINNRELRRTPIKDLISLRAYYATMVSRERARKSGRRRFGRSVRVDFGF